MWRGSKIHCTLYDKYQLLSAPTSLKSFYTSPNCHFTMSTFTCSFCEVSDAENLPEREAHPDSSTEEIKQIDKMSASEDRPKRGDDPEHEDHPEGNTEAVELKTPRRYTKWTTKVLHSNPDEDDDDDGNIVLRFCSNLFSGGYPVNILFMAIEIFRKIFYQMLTLSRLRRRPEAIWALSAWSSRYKDIFHFVKKIGDQPRCVYLFDIDRYGGN